jgi:hypothetical protein
MVVSFGEPLARVSRWAPPRATVRTGEPLRSGGPRGAAPLRVRHVAVLARLEAGLMAAGARGARYDRFDAAVQATLAPLAAEWIARGAEMLSVENSPHVGCGGMGGGIFF